MDVIEWAKRGEQLGAGEILITSIDQEGTRKGMDCDLIRAITDAVKLPVIASGGAGSPSDVVKAITESHADAVAMADILHYRRHPLSAIRTAAIEAGIHVRRT